MKEFLIPVPEKSAYPETQDQFTQEVFGILTQINMAINQRKDKPNPSDEDDKFAAKELSRAVVRMYLDPDKKELDLERWQDGLDILRQMKDQVTGVVKIEEIRIDELKMEPKEARQKLFFDRLEFLKKRLDGLDCRSSFKNNLKDLRGQFDESMTAGNKTAEAIAWLGLKNLEILNDKEITFLSEMFDRQY